MCNLCIEDKAENAKAREELQELAKTLRKHANQVEGMAFGRIKPHTNEVKEVELTARSIVRDLVREWV